MFDPRVMPKRTAEMLGDIGLCRAIDSMRPRRRLGAAWPYVERLCEVEGRPAWAVDDKGKRYVVLNGTVFKMSDLGCADVLVREAAKAAFARLDQFNRPVV